MVSVFPIFDIFFFQYGFISIQSKKKKEKDSNTHYYGCGREVVYASEWFFLFKAMVDGKKKLSLVVTKWICHHVGSPPWHLGDVKLR